MMGNLRFGKGVRCDCEFENPAMQILVEKIA